MDMTTRNFARAEKWFRYRTLVEFSRESVSRSGEGRGRQNRRRSRLISNLGRPVSAMVETDGLKCVERATANAEPDVC